MHMVEMNASAAHLRWGAGRAVRAAGMHDLATLEGACDVPAAEPDGIACKLQDDATP